jgi:peroxiredoxin
MPGLQDYYDEHRDHGLMLVAVNVGETPGTARAFVEANGFSFPVALDPDSRVADLYGVTGLPVTLVVDAEGRMVYQHTGLITRDVLDTQVVPLLGR